MGETMTTFPQTWYRVSTWHGIEPVEIIGETQHYVTIQTGSTFRPTRREKKHVGTEHYFRTREEAVQFQLDRLRNTMLTAAERFELAREAYAQFCQQEAPGVTAEDVALLDAILADIREA